MKQHYFLSFLLLSVLSIYNAFATDYFIDPAHGNDWNNGRSSTSAFRSLYKIDGINLQPGDTVYFMEGTYQRPGQTLLTINESGSKNNYITFTNYEDHIPVLEFDGWTGIDIIGGSSYIKIDGLHIKGARIKVDLEDALAQGAGCEADLAGGSEGFYNGTGILAVGPNLKWSNGSTNSVPHHITVTNCEVYDCTSSGMAFQQADYVTITNNKVYNNCWYTIYGTSGINLYQFVNTDGTTGFHNIVTNNLMYGNQLLVPQVPYCAFYDGNGFIIDDFKHSQTFNYKDADAGYDSYTGKSLIANNVSVENGGSGLHFFLSSYCYILNNTIVNNAFQNNGSNGNAELRIGNCNEFVIKNNILKSENKVHANGGNTNIEYINNYQYGPSIQNALVDCEGCISTNEITFLNTDIEAEKPYITDFSDVYTDAGAILTEIDIDYLGNARPYGDSFDIGAYELRDEDACEILTWYADADEDGLGDINDSIEACEQPEGYIAESGDLCPTDSNKTNPGECGCGFTEESCIEECEELTWYADADKDGLGDANESIEGCEQPNGYVAQSGDLCPNDSQKTNPGECGCSVDEGTCNEEPGDICDSPEYDSSTAYAQAGTTVIYNGNAYENKWYTQGQLPTGGGPWELVTFCDAELTDCSSINLWSSSTIYAAAGSQVVYGESIYENKWYVHGGVPGVNSAWQMVGFCATANANAANASYQLIVHDLSGNALLNSQSDSTNIEAIDMNNLDSGIYILHFTNLNTGNTTVEKISK